MIEVDDVLATRRFRAQCINVEGLTEPPCGTSTYD